MAFFLVTFARGPAWDPGRSRREQDGWDRHAAFLDDLVGRGVVRLGGPLGDDVDAGDALLLVSAPGPEAAAAAVAGDPWLGSVLVVRRVERWTLWLGAQEAGWVSTRP